MKWIMAMAAVLAVPALALGAASFALDVGGETAIEICKTTDPSFTLSLGITQDDANGCGGFGGALQASANGVFEVTKRIWTIPGPRFDGATNVQMKGFISPMTKNFGSISMNDNGYWNAAFFPAEVEKFNITIPATTPNGVYTICIGDPGGGIYVMNYDGSGNQAPLTSNCVEVTVVPEPASMLLLVGALPFLRRRRSA